MKGHVYILRSSKDNRTYVGSTDNLERRIREHKRGLVQSTRNRRPLELIFLEECDSISEARLREKFFKTGAGRRLLKKIIGQHIAG